MFKNKLAILVVFWFGTLLSGCYDQRVKVYPVDGFAVAGRVSYERVTPTVNFFKTVSKVKDEAPVAYALLQVVDTSDGDKVVAGGATDRDGVFIIGLPADSKNSPLQVKVLTVSSIKNFPMMVMDQSTKDHVYHAGSEIFIGTKNDMLISIDGNAFHGTLAGAFNIFSRIMQGHKFLADYGGEKNTQFPELQILWESGKVGVDCTCFFKQFLSPATINLRQDENDDAVILHEFGHYLHLSFSNESSPGGSHILSCNQNDDPRLTWSEGWATGFSLIVRKSEYYIDTDNQNFYIAHESPCHMGQGPVSETIVAAMYLDLFDGPKSELPSKDGDTINITFLQIWNAMKNVRKGVGLTVYDFYTSLLATGVITSQQWQDNFGLLGLDVATMLLHADAASKASPETSPEAPPEADPEFLTFIEPN